MATVDSSTSLNKPCEKPARRRPGITCGCNKSQPVAFYCNDHQVVICGACKTFLHQKCKTSSIQEKSLVYKVSKLNAVLVEIKSLNVKYERLKQESRGNKRLIGQLKEVCSKEIKMFRKELDTIFDNLESNMLTELDEWGKTEDRNVDQAESTISSALNDLKEDCKRLEDAKRDGKKDIMFIADAQVSKSLQEYKRKLEELDKDIENSTLSFKRNETLADLATGINSLGYFKVQRKSPKQDNKPMGIANSTGSTKILVDRRIKSRSEVSVITGDDDDDTCISGCAVLPNGNVVICDQENKQIKLLDDFWAITGRLRLPNPWDVSVIDPSNVIVSSPDKKQLHNIQVFPQMKAERIIQLDKKCWGVAVYGEEIYTTCHNDPGDGEIRVLDMKGNVKTRIRSSRDGSCLFNSPSYITVSVSGEKIFVSDWHTRTVTCMVPSGRVIYTYKDDDMRRIRGLICDSIDNVLVCGQDSDSVYIITKAGKGKRSFLLSKDGITNPFSIAFKETDDTLIVGCWNSNELRVLKLA